MVSRPLLGWLGAGVVLIASDAGASGAPHTRGAEQPRVLVFNHGYDFPIPFNRTFDFDQLPFAGEYRDVTLDGIRLRAPGLRAWQHLDGSPLGDRAARQRDSAEFWRVDLPADSYAFEFRLWESSNPGVGSNTCFNFDFCTDTLYRIMVFSGNELIREFDFSPYNNTLNTMALWSSVPITRVDLTAVTDNVDDEFLGDIRTGSTPLPEGLDIAASQQNLNFGTHAALRDDHALISDSAGFEFWRRSGPSSWEHVGRLDFSDTIQRIAVGADHAVVAVSTTAGSRLRIYELQGDDPALWPQTELEFLNSARDIEIEDDLIVLGVDGQVFLYRQDALDGWIFETTLLAAPPIPNATEFGRDIAMDGDLLVVSAGSGLFHVYQRGTGAQFDETYRQVQVLTNRSYIDLSGSTLAMQTFEGSLRIFEPDLSGDWVESQFPFSVLPPEIGLALGEGIRIDGDTLMTLQAYQNSPNPSLRRIVSVWRLDASMGQYSRSALFVEPHQTPFGETRLGNAGLAFALDGDDILLGIPATPWCDYAVGIRSFFGDTGTNGYAAVCAGRSGAAYFARASRLDQLIFESGFESAAFNPRIDR